MQKCTMVEFKYGEAERVSLKLDFNCGESYINSMKDLWEVCAAFPTASKCSNALWFTEMCCANVTWRRFPSADDEIFKYEQKGITVSHYKQTPRLRWLTCKKNKMKYSTPPHLLDSSGATCMDKYCFGQQNSRQHPYCITPWTGSCPQQARHDVGLVRCTKGHLHGACGTESSQLNIG